MARKIDEKEMLSDIGILLDRLDSEADSLSNSHHFNAKFFVDDMRKKYGIKTNTYVSASELFGGRQTVDKFKKNYSYA